eukprot:431930-Rhodomonas_salina.2
MSRRAVECQWLPWRQYTDANRPNECGSRHVRLMVLGAVGDGEEWYEGHVPGPFPPLPDLPGPTSFPNENVPPVSSRPFLQRNPLQPERIP